MKTMCPSVVTAMALWQFMNCTSFARVHELPQSHYGDIGLSYMYSLYYICNIYIYSYNYKYDIYIYIHVCFSIKYHLS